MWYTIAGNTRKTRTSLILAGWVAFFFLAAVERTSADTSTSYATDGFTPSPSTSTSSLFTLSPDGTESYGDDSFTSTGSLTTGIDDSTSFLTDGIDTDTDTVEHGTSAGGGGGTTDTTYAGTLPTDEGSSGSSAAGSLTETPSPSASTTTSARARDVVITPSPAAADEEDLEANADGSSGACVSAGLPPRMLVLVASVLRSASGMLG